MAYVTVNWSYGDTSNVSGFKIYRDGVLRADLTDTTLRTYEDSIDDITDPDKIELKYEVKAYDQLGRESKNCGNSDFANVNILKSLIPSMTSKDSPSGHIEYNNNWHPSGSSNPINLFSNDNNYVFVKNGFQISYEFETAQNIKQIGFNIRYYSSNFIKMNVYSMDNSKELIVTFDPTNYLFSDYSSYRKTLDVTVNVKKVLWEFEIKPGTYTNTCFYNLYLYGK